jgi:hypothetical protein
MLDVERAGPKPPFLAFDCATSSSTSWAPVNWTSFVAGGFVRILDVNAGNVERLGFFCKMSQPKNAGYRCKASWLQARFAEGLRIKLLDLSEGGRGFIEYVPGKHAWRAVNADGYLFINCLWVVGASKGNGYGTRLLKACIADARREKYKGVAMLSSSGNWLMSAKLLAANGFKQAGVAAPTYSLWALTFGDAKPPTLPDNWNARAKRFGAGLTIIRSDQCPYLDDAVRFTTKVADEAGVRHRILTFEDAQTLQAQAPSPYGVFSTVLNGRLLSHYYLGAKKFSELLQHR